MKRRPRKAARLLAALVEMCALAYEQCQLIVTAGRRATRRTQAWPRSSASTWSPSTNTHSGRSDRGGARHSFDAPDLAATHAGPRRRTRVAARGSCAWHQSGDAHRAGRRALERAPYSRPARSSMSSSHLAEPRRELRPGRTTADRCVRMLQVVALAMQDQRRRSTGRSTAPVGRGSPRRPRPGCRRLAHVCCRRG